ncbi:MAG: hypothetical protein HKP61_04220 [Dactylosporangium sp.]|nr:hypothetical protein [Dactylosporangium sp.]NNJ60158.1 hypothetical protein [Dactylosporangium sp.]
MSEISHGNTELWQPDWVAPLAGYEVVPVSDNKKDELIHRVLESARSKFDYGHSSQTRNINGLRVDEWKLNTPDGAELSRLWVVSENAQLRFFVAGLGALSTLNDDAWRQCIAAGVAKLGNRDSFEWMAIISQRSQIPTIGGGQRLAEAVTIGDLTFTPFQSGVADEVLVNMPPVGLHVNSFFHWPLELHGRVSCFDWEKDGHSLALQRLRRITALLSLSWDADWRLREGPRDPKTKFANSEGPLLGTSWKKTNPSLPFAGAPVEVPTWLPRAEATLNENTKLLHAVLVHQEGASLCREHSSMALISFVAAIEAVAQVAKKPERCQECKSVLGSADRFRNAVREVLSEPEAELLAAAYGSKRSKTVHQGRLHGLELEYGGWGSMSLFVPDDSFTFSMRTVSVAQRASRSLLLRVLGVTPQSAYSK